MIFRELQNIQASVLGMGNMRLPSKDPRDRNAAINYEEAVKVIHEAYKGGINYYDTAYVYNSGDSEKCVGEAMKAFERSAYYLATKYYIDANPDYADVFETQLQRLRTEYIDFYLLHAVGDKVADKYLKSGAIEYFRKKKEEGKIRYLGFSTHASPEVMKRFLYAYDWDFVQIQMNYYDWLYETAKEEYEIITEKNVPIIVMEPVRGGVLADLTDEAMGILKKAHPDWSAAEWAFRFVKSFENVRVILSGMSTTGQVQENVKTFSDEKGLTKEEMDILFKACELFKKKVQVPCTACRYCCAGCAGNINIPAYLKVYNNYKVEGHSALWHIDEVQSEGRPSDCIDCGSCMHHCPQGIEVPSLMHELAQAMA